MTKLYITPPTSAPISKVLKRQAPPTDRKRLSEPPPAEGEAWDHRNTSAKDRSPNGPQWFGIIIFERRPSFTSILA